MSNSKTGILGRECKVVAGRTRGPLGRKDAADPSLLMSLAGDTPGSLGSNSDLACVQLPEITEPKPKLLIYDLQQIAKFLRGVAVAKAQQHFTRIDWEDYNESTVINVIYALMPWKGKPGTAVISQGAKVDIFARADADVDHLLEVFLKKCTEGPVQAQAYLEQQQKIREYATAAVQDTFREASQINQAVAAETQNGINWLTRIKCSADLFMTGAGLVTGGTAVQVAARAVIGLGYPIIKEWAAARDADAIAVVGVTELGKKAAEKAGEVARDAIIPPEVQKLGRWEAEAAVLQKQDLIAKYQQELVGKGASKQAKLAGRISRRTAEMQKLQKAASPTRRLAGKTLGSLNLIFAAKDAYGSITELVDTFTNSDSK